MQQTTTAIQFLGDFFHTFETNHIHYSVLRGYEDLPAKVSNDIDIFIKPEDFIKAQNTLLELIESIRLCSTTVHFGMRKYILQFSNNEIITLDLFNAISWKGLLVADSTAITQYIKKHNDISVSREGTEAAIVILKELLMFGRIKSRNNAKERIYNCLEKDEESFTETLKKFLGSKTKWLKKQIHTKNWQAIEENTNMLRRTIFIKNISTRPLQTAPNFFSWFTLRMKDKLSNKRGSFIAIIGPDGSGKTTLVNNVNAKLNGTLFTKTNHFASNFEILPLLSTILRFLKSKKEPKATRGIDQFQGLHSGMKQEINPPLRSCIYIMWYSLDLILGRVILWKKKSRGELIFFARYFYDYYYQRANKNAPSWLLDLMLWFIPKPDLVFYIDRDASNIFKLKPELSIAEIERQQQIILNLAKKHAHFIKIDGNKGIEKSKDQIIEELAKLLASRV